MVGILSRQSKNMELSKVQINSVAGKLLGSRGRVFLYSDTWYLHNHDGSRSTEAIFRFLCKARTRDYTERAYRAGK